jgi:hypothetical protein
VASGDLGGHGRVQVASGLSGLGDRIWPHGFADDLGIVGGLVGSRVAMGGRGHAATGIV